MKRRIYPDRGAGRCFVVIAVSVAVIAAYSVAFSAPAAAVTRAACKKLQVVAHRGGVAGRDKLHTEDSLGSFKDTAALAKKASRHGVTVTAETDIWRTKPDASGRGAWVSNHDRTLDRTTTGTGEIADHTWDELAGVRYDDGEPLTRFGPAVAYLATTKAHFQVEVKPDEVSLGSLRALLRIVRANHMLKRFEFTSFHADTLRHLRKLNSSVRLGYLTFHSTVPRHLRKVVDDVAFKTTHATKANIAAAHAAGLRVGVWVPNSASAWRTYIKRGVNAISTDEAGTYYDWCMDR